MGSVRGFLEIPRQEPRHRHVPERLADWREFTAPLPPEELRRQGARCMDCGIPYCQSSYGCPVMNLIPEWNDLVYRDRWKEAYLRLEKTNTLPEITGRVCPAPCESACTLSINSAPVTIKQIELAVVERAFTFGWAVARPPAAETGKRVAVVGSGPAGLAAAQQLRRAGHSVRVFERADKPGGLLRYGIPDFKLEKRIIDRRLEQMSAEGINFECNVTIGEDISASYLRRSFDAVVLCLGAGEPRDLAVPGRELEGVHFALEYLRGSNRFVAGELPAPPIDARDKRVLVIGGGDTGSDCVGTANRQGAAEVTQIEILPRPREWSESWNPQWPEWPAILRTSSSHEEGCTRRWSVMTRALTGKGGRVTAAECVELDWNQGTMQERLNSAFTIPADLVLLALGFLHVEHGPLVEQFGLELTDRGNVRVDENHETSVPGVFCAGDAHTGANLVVRAIHHGREAAAAVIQRLAD